MIYSESVCCVRIPDCSDCPVCWEDFCLMGSLLATKPPGLKRTVILANMKRKYPQYSNEREREIPIGKFTPKPA